jgi:hypothetical protein
VPVRRALLIGYDGAPQPPGRALPAPGGEQTKMVLMNAQYLSRPAGIYVVSGVNLLLGVLIGIGLYVHFHGLQPFQFAARPLVYADVVLAAGMVLTAGGVFFGVRVFRPATRIFLYVVALYEALVALLKLSQQFDATDFITFLLTVVLVLYCIGARGYLNADGARYFFGEPGQSAA